MSQTMIKKAVLTTPSLGGDGAKTFLQNLANLIGCNYDSENNIMYMGEDSSFGFTSNVASNKFHIYLHSTEVSYSGNYLPIYPAIGSSYQLDISQNTKYTIRYIKTDNVVLFTFDGENETNNNYARICVGAARGKIITNEDEETWIYFGRSGSTFCYITNGSTVQEENVNKAKSSSDVISIVPFFINEGDEVYKSDYLFFVASCSIQQDNIAFMFDNNEYLIISNTYTNNSNTERLAVKLT